MTALTLDTSDPTVGSLNNDVDFTIVGITIVTEPHLVLGPGRLFDQFHEDEGFQQLPYRRRPWIKEDDPGSRRAERPPGPCRACATSDGDTCEPCFPVRMWRVDRTRRSFPSVGIPILAAVSLRLDLVFVKRWMCRNLALRNQARRTEPRFSMGSSGTGRRRPAFRPARSDGPRRPRAPERPRRELRRPRR